VHYVDETSIARVYDHLLAKLEPDERVIPTPVSSWSTFYTSIRPPAKNSSDTYVSDYQGASKLQRVAMVHGVAIIMLYHTHKAEASDYVETIQGTLGTAEAWPRRAWISLGAPARS
jgi:hypothetical protein